MSLLSSNPVISSRCQAVRGLVGAALGAALALSAAAAWATTEKIGQQPRPEQRMVELRIGGTGNALGTMRLLAQAFASTRPEVRPLVLASIGTSGAIKAVPRGAIQIGLSSRPLTPEEAATGLVSVEYARSPTVLAVREINAVKQISRSEIAAIYQGKLTAWPDGSRIRPLLRQPGDDNTRQLKSLSPEIEQAVVAAEKQPGMAFAVTDQEAADKLESIQGSFGVTTLGLIRSEQRGLRALPLDGIEPSTENARAGRYPLIKQFYFIVPRDASPEVQDFVRFARSPQAKKIFEDTGHYLP